ncbi:MAG: hypothetical protein V1712_03485 [Patescibacteria group bacterium]
MNFKFESFLWGTFYMLALGFIALLMVVIFKSLTKMEKAAEGGQRFSFEEEIDNKWFWARFFLTGMFWLFGLELVNMLLNFTGWVMPKKSWQYLPLALVFSTGAIGWAIISWVLARLWLKWYAPTVYKIYRPYYQPSLRKNIRKLEIDQPVTAGS